MALTQVQREAVAKIRQIRAERAPHQNSLLNKTEDYNLNSNNQPKQAEQTVIDDSKVTRRYSNDGKEVQKQRLLKRRCEDCIAAENEYASQNSKRKCIEKEDVNLLMTFKVHMNESIDSNRHENEGRCGTKGLICRAPKEVHNYHSSCYFNAGSQIMSAMAELYSFLSSASESSSTTEFPTESMEITNMHNNLQVSTQYERVNQDLQSKKLKLSHELGEVKKILEENDRSGSYLQMFNRICKVMISPRYIGKGETEAIGFIDTLLDMVNEEHTEFNMNLLFQTGCKKRELCSECIVRDVKPPRELL